MAEANLKPVNDEFVQEAEAEVFVTRARALLYSGSLPEVAANRATINALIEEAVKLVGYGGIPNDLWDMVAMLDDLISGKVDRIALHVEKTIPAHLADLAQSYADQKQRFENQHARLKLLLKEAIQWSGGKQISGLFWAARLQNNSMPSVVVTDPAKVPPIYKRRRFSMSFDFPISAKLEKEAHTLLLKYGGEKMMAAGVTNFKGDVEELIPSKPLSDVYCAEEEKLKAKLPKAKKGSEQEIDRSEIKEIPGVTIMREKHLRIGASKVAAGDLNVQPIKLPPVSLEGAKEHGEERS